MKSAKIPYALTALWIFGGAAAAAAGYFVLEARLEDHRRPLAHLRAADISVIELERGQEKVVLESEEGRWRMSAPVSDETDREAVAAFVGGLFKLKVGKAVAHDPEAYPSFGLAEGRLHLRVLARRKRHAVLDANFGGEALGSDSHYFRYARDLPVFVADGPETALLSLAAADFRQKRLVPLEAGEIEELEITCAGLPYLYQRQAQSSAAPEGPAARLLGLRAEGFAAAEEAEREGAFRAPALCARARGRSRSLRLEVGGPRPEPDGGPSRLRYARAEGRTGVMLVSAAEVDAVIQQMR